MGLCILAREAAMTRVNAAKAQIGADFSMTAKDDIIPSDVARTLYGLFRERVRRSPNAMAYREFDQRAEAWRSCTWRDMDDRAAQIRGALSAAGLTAGDRLAIALPNGSDWMAFDIAALSLGLVVVPLYIHDSAANLAFILTHSGARLLVIDTEARWSTLLPHWPELVDLEHIWIRDGISADNGDLLRPGLKPLNDVLSTTAGGSPAPPPAEALATIIYTSGTTGYPKGVMLTHQAMLWNATAAARVIPPTPEDVFLSCLPLAHAFERTVGCYLPMIGGSTVVYARSIETLSDDFRTIRPTVFLGVPRIYERASAALARARKIPLQCALVEFTADLGWRQFEARQGRGKELRGPMRAMWKFLDHWIGARVRSAFGGRLRVMVSGGAQLPVDVARFLIGLGLPLIEGYGLTEAAPVVATNTIADNLPGSVGRPLEGIELKLLESGELIVRTPSVMTGYWRDDDLTAKALDSGGWLHTGDIAEIRDGRLFIRGRTKELIVLSTGEKVSPSDIETRITQDPLFAHALVVGDGKPFLTAILALDKKSWNQLARKLALSADEPNLDVVKHVVLKRLEKKLEAFAHYAQVRAVHLTLEPWTVANGLLTPTLKCKRTRLEAKYAAEIAQFYQSA
jgi:long-chain acyl-CoA synthetase